MEAKTYISVLPYVIKNRHKEDVYRTYVTDSLRVISENTSKSYGGRYMKNRYYDIVNPIPEETRTGQDIINTIRDKIREIGGEPG